MNKSTSEIVDASPTDQLVQLRQIVFGAAQADLEQRLAQLQTHFDKQLTALRDDTSARLRALSESVDQGFAEAEQRLQHVDQQHDNQQADLQKQLDSQASEHEMFASETQAHLKNLDQGLDQETAKLSADMAEQIEALQSQLQKMSAELGSSKADRKTLARLLASMATNLEEDK